MSKHIGRKDRWTQTSPTRYDGLFGYVEQNQHGRWDGFVVYQSRPSLESVAIMRGMTPSLIAAATGPFPRTFRKATKPCGEHKRAREAMMAVENKAKAMQAENDPDILI